MNHVSRWFAPRGLRRFVCRKQMMPSLIAMGLAFVALAIGDPAAAEVPAARTALATGDCKATADALNEGIGRDDPEAFFLGGLIFDLGTCVTADPARAARLYQRAVDLNNSDAPAFLGMLYALGRGVPQDYAAAHRIFHAARPASGDEQASPDELIALGYAETLARIALRDVHYPVMANSRGLEADMDVIVTPTSGVLQFAGLHVGVEVGSNIARTHDFTDQIEVACRDAIARMPRPALAPDSSIRIATPWIFAMPRASNNQKARLEGVVNIGDSRVVR